MDYNKRTRKQDLHNTAQTASSHHSDKEKIQRERQKKDSGGKDIQDDERSEYTKEEDSINDEYDQDGSISFENDTESTSSQEEELEDWIGLSSSKEAREKQMKKELTYNITSWGLAGALRRRTSRSRVPYGSDRQPLIRQPSQACSPLSKPARELS